MMKFRTAVAALSTLLLAACTSLVTAPTAFMVYDFGPVASEPPLESPLVPGIVEVRAPTWLANSAMHYRLDYVAPASREVFAESRWAGHPSEMLQRLLTARLGAGRSGSGACRLRVDLDEFVQAFASSGQSQAEVHARVALIAPREETVLASRRIVVTVPAPTPDARGGVFAHRDGSRQLVAEIATWLGTLDGATGQGLNLTQRCGG
ncbi:ABC-type transport auxiliary lipoprotein family protein [Rhodocyclaceae bacterium SMB388]